METALSVIRGDDLYYFVFNDNETDKRFSATHREKTSISMINVYNTGRILVAA